MSHLIFYLTRLKKKSILSRTRSYSTSRIEGEDIDCESDLSHYRIAAKPCLVFRPSSGSAKHNNRSTVCDEDLNFKLCTISQHGNPISKSKTSSFCLEDSNLIENGRINSSKPSVCSSGGVSLSSPFVFFEPKRRYSHIEVLEKQSCQARSPPPPLNTLTAVDDVSLNKFILI